MKFQILFPGKKKKKKKKKEKYFYVFCRNAYPEYQALSASRYTCLPVHANYACLVYNDVKKSPWSDYFALFYFDYLLIPRLKGNGYTFKRNNSAKILLKRGLFWASRA